MKPDSSLKFDQNGNPKPYYGNTIISFVNEEAMEIFRQACQVQERLKQTSFADCLAFLPPPSFHITVLTLCREIDRNTGYWPEWIERTAPFREVDRLLEDRVRQIPVPDDIWMEIEECELTKIIVKPCAEEDDRRLCRYRDQVSAAVRVRHWWHESFRFHISLDYKVKELSLSQEAEGKYVCSELTRELKSRAKPFLLPAPRFVIFNDMMSYEQDLSKRGGIH